MANEDRHVSILRALRAFREGGFVMVMDSDEREDECDLVISAEKCTEEQMAFMIKHSTGIVCVVAEEELLLKMDLHPATGSNTDRNATNFFVSTDYLVDTTTGVSAGDRVATIKAMCSENILPSEFSKPGHMFPLAPKKGGVLEREGHTESAYDLCRLAGLKPVSAIGELMHQSGKMFRLKDSKMFSAKYNIPLIKVQDIIEARKDEEYVKKKLKGMNRRQSAENLSEIKDCCNSQTSSVERTEECSIRVEGIEDLLKMKVHSTDEGEIVFLIKGEVSDAINVPVRIHSECFTGDTLGSHRCDCGKQLAEFKAVMNQSQCSVLVYHRAHEGRGIGLMNKVAAYKLQNDELLDTVDANLKLGFDIDLRSYKEARKLLERLGIGSIILYTNSPDKADAFAGFCSEVKPLTIDPNPDSFRYLATKVSRMGHAKALKGFSLPALRNSGNIEVSIVFSMWNKEYLNPVVNLIKKRLLEKDVIVSAYACPGALDLVATCRKIATSTKTNAIIALGLLLQSKGGHYEAASSAILQSLLSLNASQDVPICPSVFMYHNEQDAIAATSGDNNPGRALADQAVFMASMRENVQTVELD